MLHDSSEVFSTSIAAKNAYPLSVKLRVNGDNLANTKKRIIRNEDFSVEMNHPFQKLMTRSNNMRKPFRKTSEVSPERDLCSEYVPISSFKKC